MNSVFFLNIFLFILIDAAYNMPAQITRIVYWLNYTQNRLTEQYPAIDFINRFAV